MEAWEVAAVFGLADGDGQPGSTTTPDLSLLEQRVAYAEGRGPKPQPAAMNPQEALRLAQAMGAPGGAR
jgi:hypothetical protein